MDQKKQERIQKLAFLLKQMDKIHLRDAAQILNVSDMTIRRDLSDAPNGMALLGGYIVQNRSNQLHRYHIFEQEHKHIPEKMAVGKMAADLVQDGDIIFFDCGSTIPYIASQIRTEICFTAICCSINTFMVLQEKPNCQLILCGGEYSRHNSFLTSMTLQNELDAICTNKAFISAAGIHTTQGVTCFSFDEAKTKQKAMAKSKQSILVFDHTKLNRVEKAYIAPLEQFDLILCDQECIAN
ncbi:MAG: DNA-binding transcriptional repressor DeoR [Pasteurellaceae bacterium]|nr:DNA-binding transcriptional repressor DeoR [Pasteurellaceae bacterium]